jgi:tRNA pseudouridine38/39 synthase
MEEVLDSLRFSFAFSKPQYSMAVDYPLVLYDVKYPEEENIQWTYTTENMTALLSDIQRLWMHHSIKLVNLW